MTEDRLDGIDYFLGNQRLFHPQRGSDYIARKDLIWLVEEIRRLRRIQPHMVTIRVDGDVWTAAELAERYEDQADRLASTQVTIGQLSHEIARLRELLGRGATHP